MAESMESHEGRGNKRGRMSHGLFDDEGPAPAPVILRPYQEKINNAWDAFIDKGGQRGLVVAATGAGKTVIFNTIIRKTLSWDLGATALALAHRKELLVQIRDTAKWINADMPCSIHSGDDKATRGSRIVAASVQTVGLPHSTALDWLSPNIVVCDEAHHAAADTYQRAFTRFGCYDDYGTTLCGVTATPHRLDNKALVGKVDKAIFEEIVFRYDIVAAIKDGFLVDLKGYRAAAKVDLSKVKVSRGDYQQNQLEDAMNVDPVNQLAYESWVNAGKGHQTIVFCAGVDHAKAVAEVFREKGIKAAAVWGDMPPRERIQVIDDFRAGRIKVLTNMDILTEGFDAREAGCVILLRPTKSWSLFVQMIGRGLRTLPGIVEGIEFEDASVRRAAIRQSSKPECIVIDIVAMAGEEGHNVTEKKDGTGDPCLNALVGLPEGLDLEGHSVIEALEEFEEMPEVVRAAANRRRKLNFSDLTAVLSQVEMLLEIEPPEEAVQNGELYWLKTGDLEYQVDCGSQGGCQRKAVLIGDFIGNWKLVIESTFRDPKEFAMPDNLPLAFRAAEGVIANEFMGVSRLASRKAQWRLGSPTVNQVMYLKGRGIDQHILDNLTKGSASAMISVLRAKEARENDQREAA